MRQNFSAQGVHEYRHGQAISGILAKFHNAVMENSGRKAAAHNLIRGSLAGDCAYKIQLQDKRNISIDTDIEINVNLIPLATNHNDKS